METWLPVIGWESYYEVSNQGQVRSLDRTVTDSRKTRAYRGRILRPSHIASGHQMVVLSRQGFRETCWVHVLVAEAFLGPRPSGQQVCHRDGRPEDNRPENLRWGTPASNAQDAIRHKTNRNTRKQTCPAGHVYDRFYPSGRRCSICDAIRDRERGAARAEGRRRLKSPTGLAADS